MFTVFSPGSKVTLLRPNVQLKHTLTHWVGASTLLLLSLLVSPEQSNAATTWEPPYQTAGSVQSMAINASGWATIANIDAGAITVQTHTPGASWSEQVTTEILESVLSKQLNEIEATLVRNGYRIKDLVEQFDAKPSEIKALFNNTLETERATELRNKMLQAGLPL